MRRQSTVAPTIGAFKRDADLLEKAWRPGITIPSRLLAVRRVEAVLPFYNDKPSNELMRTAPSRSRLLQVVAAEAGHPSWDALVIEQSRLDLPGTARYLVSLETEIAAPGFPFKWPDGVLRRANNDVIARFVLERASGRLLALHLETVVGWHVVPTENLESMAATLAAPDLSGTSLVDRLTYAVAAGETHDAYLGDTPPAWVTRPGIGAHPPATRWCTGEGNCIPETPIDEVGQAKDLRYRHRLPGWQAARGQASMLRVSGKRSRDHAINEGAISLLDHRKVWRTPLGELALTSEPYHTAVNTDSVTAMMRAAAYFNLSVEYVPYSPYFPGATVLFIFRRRYT
jgi:hypothetical protein